MHGVILDYLRQQLFDETSRLTPMPPPQYAHILLPVATVAPQRKSRKKTKATQSGLTGHADIPVQPPDSVESTTTEPGPEGTQEPLSDAVDAPVDTAGVVSDGPPMVQEQAVALTDVQDAWPVDTRLSYSVKGYYRGDFYGWGQVQWQHSDGRYQVQVDMRLALIFTGTLISQGELTADGLQPRVYEERGMGRVRRVAFEGGTVTLHDGSTVQQPPGLQDTASQFVELTHRFSSGRQALEVGAEVPVWLARPREMMLWTYDVVALETLQLPELGAVQAFHLKPRPLVNPRGVINADLWFAPGLQYLPVRIRINLGNDNYAEMTVKRIDQAASPVTAAP